MDSLVHEEVAGCPTQMPDGSLVQKSVGTPQGGVASPLAANLFLHYVFDVWMEKNFPSNPFERYADDAIVHCRSRKEAEDLLAIKERFEDCKLSCIHRKRRSFTVRMPPEQKTFRSVNSTSELYVQG